MSGCTAERHRTVAGRARADRPCGLLPDRRHRRPCAGRRHRLRRSQVRPDLRQPRRHLASDSEGATSQLQRASEPRPLLGLPRRRRRELWDRDEFPLPDAPDRRRLVLPGGLAVVGRRPSPPCLAGVRAACSRRAVLDALPGHEWPARTRHSAIRQFQRPVLRQRDRAQVTHRATRLCRHADGCDRRDALVPRRDHALGRLPSARAMPRRGTPQVQGQVRLHRRAALERGDQHIACRPGGEPGEHHSRRRRAPLRRLRRCDQPRALGGHRLRPPQRALLDPVLLELGRQRRR